MSSADHVKHLLIIDADPNARAALRRLLSGPDCTLTFVCTGPDGLAKAAEMVPDLILLDVFIPGGDGFEVCRSLRATPALAEVPIILMSAVDDSLTRLRARVAGADDCISKRFDFVEVQARVRSIGRHHRNRRQKQERAKLDYSGDIGPFLWDAQPLAQLALRSVTPRRWADAGARWSEQRFYDSFEHSPDAIVVATHDGVVRDVNSAACRLYGLSRERLLDRQIVDLAPPSRQARVAQLLATLGHDTIERFEEFSATADGRSVPVEIHVSPTEYAGAPAWLLHVRDITRTKQLEGQLLQSQQLEGIGRLASGVAHDFNNLLTVISGYANLALDQLSPNDPLYSDLREIQVVVERANRLIRQLLAFARQQVIEPQLLDLNDLILELSTLLRHLIGEDIELVINPAPELALIRADPSQIERLLVNLAVNARDAMPAGGKLIIEVRNIKSDDGSVRPYVGACGAVRLTVMDTGVGMDELVKRRLFELFYTTKALGHGTGLGLATCYGIVKQHGGHIEVESELQQGTTFTIYLPAASCSEN